MIFLLSGFLSILIGSSLGIFLTTYFYPHTYSFNLISTLLVPVLLASLVFLFFFVSTRRSEFLLGFIVTSLLFFSFSYSSARSKQRLNELLKIPPQTFIEGKVKVSFLNKVFVEVSNYTVLLYLRDFDREFSVIGSRVIVSGKAKHIYHYLTNRNMYGYFLHLFGNRVPYVMYSDEESVGEIVHPESLFFDIVSKVRQDVYERFFRYLPHTSSISVSLVLGESSDMSNEFKESIRLSGISHIFSVSGFHVGVIVVAFVVFLNLFRIPRLVQFFIVSFFLLGYSLIVGLKPPVLRASILASIALFIRSLNLEPNYLNLTLAVGIIMLLLDNFLSVDVGFILSFLAVISIIIFPKYIDEAFVGFLNRRGIEPGGVIKGVVSLFSVSFVAVMFTLPVVLLWFGNSPIIGIISSVVMVPLSSLNIVGSIVACIFSYLVPAIGELMFRGVNLLNLIFVILTELFSRIGLVISIPWRDPVTTGITLLLYYLIVTISFVWFARIR